MGVAYLQSKQSESISQIYVLLLINIVIFFLGVSEYFQLNSFIPNNIKYYRNKKTIELILFLGMEFKNILNSR